MLSPLGSTVSSSARHRAIRRQTTSSSLSNLDSAEVQQLAAEEAAEVEATRQKQRAASLAAAQNQTATPDSQTSQTTQIPTSTALQKQNTTTSQVSSRPSSTTSSLSFNVNTTSLANQTALRGANVTSAPISSATPTLPSGLSSASPITAQSASTPMSPVTSATRLPATATAVIILITLVASAGMMAFLVQFIKRRRNLSNSKRSVEKINIKGPFQKPESLSDESEIFRGHEHSADNFEALNITTEKMYSSLQDQEELCPSVAPTKFSQPSVSFALPVTSHPPTQNYTGYPKKNKPPKFEDSSTTASSLPPSAFKHTPKSMMGHVFMVQRTFQPALPDELVISVGNRLKVDICYDDGWCLGENLDAQIRNGSKMTHGVFPRDCISAQPLESETKALLPPLELGGQYITSSQDVPGIRVSSSSTLLTAHDTEVMTRFPNPPTTRSGREQQRISSLIEGRDTKLYLELGEALGQKSIFE